MGSGISDDAEREQASSLVVSDSGQLAAFTDPHTMKILRILQEREATAADLARVTGEPASAIDKQIQGLSALGLIRVMGQRDQDTGSGDVYRATARVYDFRPEAGDMKRVSSPVTAASLESVGLEVVSSLISWPDQRINYEGRRARLPMHRVLEFNEELNALIDEYWGSPDQPVEENPNDPMMAMVGLWYRFRETD